MPRTSGTCPFCVPEQLSTVLAETEHFRVVADHAPLVSGHTLVMPRAHLACYGEVPAEWDDELAGLRAQITAFLTEAYQPVVWFEHGVFHQTVYHAHLHAMPLGLVNPTVVGDPALEGHTVAGRAEVRAWYAEHGPYTYLEEPDGAAALFAADEARYHRVLMTLHRHTPRREAWQGPAERYQQGAPRVRALMERWHAYHRDHMQKED